LVSRKLWEAIEREDAIHWLSTLGGAFSNLGEHNVAFVSVVCPLSSPSKAYCKAFRVLGLGKST
jgi:hypothetical protein